MRALYLWLLWLWWKWRKPRIVLESRDGKWPRIKAEHLEREPACIVCGNTKPDELTVHHEIPVSIAPHRELDPENLATMCKVPCHFVFGHFMSYHCYNKNVRKTASAFKKEYDLRSCHYAGKKIKLKLIMLEDDEHG